MAHATLAEVADFLNVEPRWINRLVKEKGMPRLNRGAYDLKVCVHWYIRFLKDQIEEAGGGGESLQRAELRKAVAEADRLEIKLARERGEIISISAAQRVISLHVKASRDRLLSIPRRAAPQCVGLEKAAIAEHLITQLVYEALNDLSAIPDRIRDLAEVPAEGDEAVVPAVPSASRAHRKRVGRPAQKAKRGGKRGGRPVPKLKGPVPEGDDGRGRGSADGDGHDHERGADRQDGSDHQ